MPNLERRNRVKNAVLRAFTRRGGKEIVTHGTPAKNQKSIMKRGLGAERHEKHAFFFRIPIETVREQLEREGIRSVRADILEIFSQNIGFSSLRGIRGFFQTPSAILDTAIIIGQWKPANRKKIIPNLRNTEYATGFIPENDILVTVHLTRAEQKSVRLASKGDRNMMVELVARALLRKAIRRFLVVHPKNLEKQK